MNNNFWIIQLITAYSEKCDSPGTVDHQNRNALHVNCEVQLMQHIKRNTDTKHSTDERVVLIHSLLLSVMLSSQSCLYCLLLLEKLHSKCTMWIYCNARFTVSSFFRCQEVHDSRSWIIVSSANSVESNNQSNVCGVSRHTGPFVGNNEIVVWNNSFSLHWMWCQSCDSC